MILPAINTAIDTSSWTAVTLPSGQDCEDYAVQARDAVVIKISSADDGATYWTLKSNDSVSLNEALGPGAYFFYAQSITSGTTIEVQPLRRHRGR
ncbi:MAG: hypothetical protein GY845_03440 [Planctomycetes bacterium]|nr:hypothetical protein [Planctomycetota bacterium]